MDSTLLAFWSGLLVLIVAIVQRHLVAVNQAPSFDFYGHLYFGTLAREQGNGPFGPVVFNTIGSAPRSMPLLWNWVVAYLPRRWLLRHQHRLNGLVDSFVAWEIFFVAGFFGLATSQALVVSAAYIFSPALCTRLAIGPRTQSFTPRLLSEVLVANFFVLGFVYSMSGNILALMGQVVAASLVLLTSKFGTQALFFLGVTYSCLALDPNPILALSGGMGLSLLVSRGQIFPIWRQHYKNLVNHFHTNRLGRSAVANRNSLTELLRLLITLRTRTALVKLGWALLGRNSYSGLVLKFPLALVAGGVVIGQLFLGGFSSLGPLELLTISAWALFIAVNQRYLLFVGEAERYLSSVAPILAIVIGMSLGDSVVQVLVLVGILYGLAFSLAEFFTFRTLTTPPALQVQAGSLVTEFLNAQPEDLVVLNYPFHAAGGTWRVLLETRHKSIYSVGSDSFMKEFRTRFLGVYPFANLAKLNEMTEEYGLNAVIVDLKKTSKESVLEHFDPSEWVEAMGVGDELTVMLRKL